MSEYKLQAPVEIDLMIFITDGERTGKVTIGMGKGRYPNEERFRERVAEFVDQEMPDGFRLMTKSEYFNSIMPANVEEDEDGEMHKVSWACPGGNDWDD